MCLICFLDDVYQYKLRKSAQLRTDRFEHTLERYKLSFIKHFFIEKEELCKMHENNFNKGIVDNINKEIKEDDIKKIFDDLISSYLCWINAQPSEAINKVKEMLERIGLTKVEYIIPNNIFFRGRVSKDFISHWDMFHIPFNKRFLISNQRYSLVGQPLLYLASSPYCVINELNDTQNLRIASFRFKETPKLKIFNNMNFISDIAHIENSSSVLDNINYMINKYSLNNETITRSFYRSILSNCCSFEIHQELKEFSFKEEYILPQILAQVLKELKFDGIMYTSTKAYSDPLIINNDNYKYLKDIYTNYCIFTKYDVNNYTDESYVYDKELFGKFIISAPLLYSLEIKEDQYSIDKTISEISILSNKDIDEYTTSLLSNISDTITGYKELIDKGNIKSELSTMYLHCLFLRNTILNITDNLML